MPRESAPARFFDSIAERQTAWFDTIRAAADRYHRFNRSLIEGARQSSADWTEVTRRFLTEPANFMGTYEAISEAIGNGQARTLALGREWWDDRVEAQRETQEVLRQGFGDVRDAVERAQLNAPDFLRRGLRRNADEEERIEATG